MRPPTEAEPPRWEGATWEIRPSFHPDNRAERRRQTKLRKWTPYRSGALIGFCSVELASGMVANDLRVMTGKNGLWAATPAQKQFHPNGNPRLDPNSKAIFKPIIEFRDRATADRIGALVIELVRAAYLDAIDAA